MPDTSLDSLYAILVSGGPLMWPIALTSILALAYIVERSIRLRAGRLHRAAFHGELLAAVRERGVAAGLQLCESAATSQARILAAGLRRAGAEWLERERAVEDAGSREVDRLSANLRPLVVIAMIAPLLGLLGTVWGMIQSFAVISAGNGLGSPEALAGGISQALVTTAAGLVVAIPAQAAYYFFKGRIDRCVRRTEDLYAELSEFLGSRAAAGQAS